LNASLTIPWLTHTMTSWYPIFASFYHHKGSLDLFEDFRGLKFLKISGA
jgi:hypothetical protein